MADSEEKNKEAPKIRKADPDDPIFKKGWVIGASKLPASKVVKSLNSINLEKQFWDQIKEAALTSKRFPLDYMMNDWVDDVCNFLKQGCLSSVKWFTWESGDFFEYSLVWWADKEHISIGTLGEDGEPLMFLYVTGDNLGFKPTHFAPLLAPLTPS